MTIRYFKALKRLRHKESDELIQAGTFFSDEGTEYNPHAGIEKIATGEAIPHVKAAPPPILFRRGFYASTTQKTINALLLGGAIDLVGSTHPDYNHLVEFGVIPSSKPKSKPKVNTKDEQHGEI